VNELHLTSLQPIPLEYLRLGSFDDPVDSRRERSGDAGILDRVRPTYKDVFPFTIYHASSKNTRRYTLYALNDRVRKKWKHALADATMVRKVQQESNMVRLRFSVRAFALTCLLVSVARPTRCANRILSTLETRPTSKQQDFCYGEDYGRRTNV
jgi:hypothetical protein